MPERVDFYLLESAGEASRFTCACKIAAKASQQGLKVYMRVDSAPQAATLDARLWDYNPLSFVPHCLTGDTMAANAKVLIGDADAPEGWRDLLISLTEEVPPDVDRYNRIADLISDDDADKATGRLRFKYYRDSGATPTIHNIRG